ncbi:MAG TPA: hypothetical protein VEW69_02615, partial [Alphaproteobacteria bacterium]|nr:hypothetical protein [Alphaproteobacteria bacterium]
YGSLDFSVPVTSSETERTIRLAKMAIKKIGTAIMIGRSHFQFLPNHGFAEVGAGATATRPSPLLMASHSSHRPNFGKRTRKMQDLTMG